MRIQLFKSVHYLIVGFFMLAALSCSDNTEDILEFDLRINNQTDTAYTIYQASNVFSGGSFNMVGTVEAMESTTIRNLFIDIDYRFRLVEGDDIENPDFENTIRSNGVNITWNVGN